MRAKLYVEGGGDSNSLKTKCREGFRKFFERAGLEGNMPRIVACGTRRAAYDDFCVALLGNGKDYFPVLLVDSEDAVNSHHDSWMHLSARLEDKWKKPDNATDKQAFLMVQCMESWFLADKESLARYFGQNFNEGALPSNSNIEAVSKNDVLEGLKKASKDTKKNKYGKGRHSFEILASIDPQKVCISSSHCKSMIEELQKMLLS